MRDRHVLETVLIRRFPGASREQVAAAANAIMSLLDEWKAEEACRPAKPVASGSHERGHERPHSH